MLSREYEIPVPPSTNALYRVFQGRSIKSAGYRKWADAVATSLKSQGAGPLCPPCELVLTIHGGTGWRVNRDLDNALKATQDAMVEAGILPGDDCQRLRLTCAKYVPAKHKKSEAVALVSVREVEA